MITRQQLQKWEKKYQTSSTVVMREYLQIWFLSKLCQTKGSQAVIFKGGTALRLIFNGERFSEDLDFTVISSEANFLRLINKVFVKCQREAQIEFKQKKTIAGKQYLLTAHPQIVKFPIFIRLDFSFRESVAEMEKTILKTDFPILFRSFIYHLSQKEILAEKVRAILTRRKGRDIYDLWFLLANNVVFDQKLINKKLKHYNKKFSSSAFKKRLSSFSQKSFILDLRPFVPVSQRQKLPQFYNYVQEFFKEKIK